MTTLDLFCVRSTRVAAVLFDRDGTLIHDVPYNGDPAAVRPVPGAREALAALRAAGIHIGVVSNQSGVGRGLLTRQQVLAVNTVVEQLLGPIDTWHMCFHAPEDDCDCRKPRPGLIQTAAQTLDVATAACVVIGDIGADMAAADAAGARSILVPTPQTLPAEIAAAPILATDIAAAVGLALEWRRA